MNNKILLAVLAALLLVFAGVKYFGKRSSPGTFPEQLVEFDSSGVDKILINPKSENGETLEFFLRDGKWRIKKAGIEIPAAEGLVPSLIGEIQNLKPKRLATKDQSKWSEFDVTDSLASRVRVIAGEELRADVLVGRISYSQAPQQSFQMGGNQVRGSSYVRVNEKNEVYSVEGFLSISFNRDFASYRNKTFLRLTRDSIESIEFIYPADSGFVLQRIDSNWSLNGLPANSGKVVEYLDKITTKNMSNFKDDFDRGQPPDFRLIFSEKGKGPTTVQGFMVDSASWVWNSSYNPESMFEEKSNLSSGQLLAPKSRFMEN